MEFDRASRFEIERRRKLQEKKGKRRQKSPSGDCREGKDVPSPSNRGAGRFSRLFHQEIEEIVEQLQTGELDLNTAISFGLYPLHEAVACGLIESTKALIELGAELTQEAHGLTPLEVAVMAGNFDAAALLIQHGAPIDRIRDGMPLLVR